MTTQTDPASLLETVCDLIAEGLSIDRAKVLPQSSLIGDLSADSLDFLDIVFKLEIAFGIQITRGELERAARGDMSDDEFAPEGIVSEAGLARLRELLPEVADKIKTGLHQREILTLFTPLTFVHLVEGKLAQSASA
jgi:acyl carrier protein